MAENSQENSQEPCGKPVYMATCVHMRGTDMPRWHPTGVKEAIGQQLLQVALHTQFGQSFSINALHASGIVGRNAEAQVRKSANYAVSYDRPCRTVGEERIRGAEMVNAAAAAPGHPAAGRG
jgi:hypothetical protein